MLKHDPTALLKHAAGQAFFHLSLPDADLLSVAAALRQTADLVLAGTPATECPPETLSAIVARLETAKGIAEKVGRFPCPGKACGACSGGSDQSQRGGEGLALAKRMVSVYSDGVLAMSLRSPKQLEISPSSRIAAAVERIGEKAKPDPFHAYGSIEGVLRRVTVDDRPDHEVSELQIIERHSSRLVECKVTPEMAEELMPQIRQRVVLYGMIKYTGTNDPVKIAVESFERIDATSIPTLEELQSMNLNIGGGEDAVDYISRLRGNE